MDTEVTTRDGITVVKPHRELRVRSVVALRTVFEDLERRGAGLIAIDMGDISYMDSSGIGLLMNFARRTRARGGKMAIFNPTDDIRALLYIAEMDVVIPFYETYNDLQQALRKGTL